MAYDLALAARIRDAAMRHRGVSEKAMFGGLAFLRDGKMFVGVLGGELLARVGPEAHDAALARPGARVMDFSGRPMQGYVFVRAAALRDARTLRRWVDECAAHVATLPDKARKPARRKAATRAAPRRRAGARAR
jgi:TfoX/Sxy family transcriptional regulator of competence genes